MARCENCGWGEVESGCDGAEMCAECEKAMAVAQTEERGEEVEA
jgi:uncharacterized Zn finger protein (UPF0148 family)